MQTYEILRIILQDEILRVI